MYILVLFLPLILFSSLLDVPKDNNFYKKTSNQIQLNIDEKKINNLSSYYKNNKYNTFWFNESSIKKLAYDLIYKIKNDPVLKPKINTLFNLKRINELLNDESLINNTNKIIELDFALTEAYDKYMYFLSNGLIDWNDFTKEIAKIKEEKEIELYWEKYSIRKNKKNLLKKAIKYSDLNIAFSSVDITYHKGVELYSFILFYEKLEEEGGFIKLEKFKSYPIIGDSSLSIALLRKRLKQEPLHQDLSCTNEQIDKCEEIFDNNLLKVIKVFQKNNGKVIDGKIGNHTIAALNITAKFRIKQLRLNYERMRWMPRTLGKKHLIVNIPDYKLKLYEKDIMLLEIDVIVGKKIYPTPIFSNKISSVVLNPYWRIPQTIVKKEIIPELVKDPLYLDSLGIRIHENWNHESSIFNSKDINWNKYLDNDLIGTSISAPMRFIQVPNEKNPLGKIKFMFPNKYSIYLHDTPLKYLFKHRNRAFSHGCIRLKKPKKLLEVFSSFDKNIDYETSSEILNDIEKTKMKLSKSIPVHLVYLTSWVEGNGDLQFRDDIYNYDSLQGKILYK